MKWIVLLFTAAVINASCIQGLEANPSSADRIDSTNALIKPLNNYSGCYQMIIKTDTANLQITEKDSTLTGTLSYRNNLQQMHSGTLKLKRVNNRLEGFYDYKNGQEVAVREIVFKMMGASLAEAYGDLKLINDSAFFKYPHALNFEEKHAFVKINCN